MKRTIQIFFLLICLFPTLASAQSVILPVDADAPGTLRATSENPNYVQNKSADGGTGADNPRATNFQIVSCTGVIDPRTNKGVVCDYAQLIATFARIISYVLYLLVPILIGMILYVGWTYITANGDVGKLAHAKDMMAPIAIGVFFVFAAYVIVYKFILGNLLADSVGEIKKTDIIGTGGN